MILLFVAPGHAGMPDRQEISLQTDNAKSAANIIQPSVFLIFREHPQDMITGNQNRLAPFFVKETTGNG